MYVFFSAWIWCNKEDISFDALIDKNIYEYTYTIDYTD